MAQKKNVYKVKVLKFGQLVESQFANNNTLLILPVE